jgi:hypothetical protein
MPRSPTTDGPALSPAGPAEGAARASAADDAEPSSAYKMICRIDYPLSYALIDNLGSFAESFHKDTAQPPFTKAHTNIDLASHTITGFLEVDDAKGNVTLGVSSLVAVLERPRGFALATIHDHPVFPTLDALVGRLATKGVSAFNRIGFRVWVIVTRSGLTFAGFRDRLAARLSGLDSAISRHFGPTDDLALIVESHDETGLKLRTAFGPYQADEYRKYFQTDPGVEEGIIFDIDYYQGSTSLPMVRVADFVRRARKTIQAVATSIDRSIGRDMQ